MAAGTCSEMQTLSSVACVSVAAADLKDRRLAQLRRDMFAHGPVMYLLSCHFILIFSKYLDKCKENIPLRQKCRIIRQPLQTNALFGPLWWAEFSESQGRGVTAIRRGRGARGACNSCLVEFNSTSCLLFITTERRTELPWKLHHVRGLLIADTVH